MLRLYVVALFCIFTCFACQTIERTPVFTPDTLPTEYFTINTNLDTVLHTSRGAHIMIPAHAIETAGGSLRLAVTEAYTISDMISAGLLTVSNGEPMSSGGMIHIRPADNMAAKIVQPIKIAIPTDYIREGMKLYKGEKDKNGNLNWVNPQPLPMEQVTQRFANARNIMQQNCAPCHALEKRVTGPALMYVTAVRDHKWLFDFIRNNAALLASGDREANCLFNEYNKTAMTLFPNLSDADIEDIIAYIDNYGKEKDPETHNKLRLAKDSCKQYFKEFAALKVKEKELIASNGEFVAAHRTYSAPMVPVTLNTVVPNTNKSVYYSFNIDSFDWYNVDILLKNLSGIVDGELRVSISGDYKENLHVFIIIPDIRMFAEGGLLDGEKHKYGFYTADGKIPMMLNKKAWIIATGEQKDQLLFAQQVFITKQKLELAISPALSTKAAINEFIKGLDLKDLKMEMTDSRNANSIREIDSLTKIVQGKKPKNWDCGCNETWPSPAPVQSL
ncbi:cytochrome c [Chitinophaga dinghuensis]|uniref:Cytochrome c n=1 Tax=Chitinophaga dinghuensis TaxID=1539050 RepID=A0A327VTC3_9BACT|nr:cytochrome c [Chitinophaga dinghuensis]RAJ77290.1 cytochrome c [Chitinophaga dinghuensis]